MTEHPNDRLDELANRYFPGRVVRKDLVRQVKVGASVPVYVLEFLLGKYAASDDPAGTGQPAAPRSPTEMQTITSCGRLRGGRASVTSVKAIRVAPSGSGRD